MKPIGVRPWPPLRIAIVGCGHSGQRHAEAIMRTEGAVLTATVDTAWSTAEQLAEKYTTSSPLSFEEVLSSSNVDAVAICTPSGLHADLAIDALLAGKHVIVEKPVDVSLVAATRLEKLSIESELKVTVISQHRFDDASMSLHTAINEGRLGTLTSGVVSVGWWRTQAYYDSAEWRGTLRLDGGGAVINQAIHSVDLLVWMLGQPAEVSAYQACLAHDRIEVEDTAAAVIRFGSGALGLVHATTAAYPGIAARIQLHGTCGSAVIDGDQLTYYGIDRPDEPDRSGRARSSDPHSSPTTLTDRPVFKGSHERQYADFIESVRSGREPRVTVTSAISVLRTVLALYESAREGGRPVSVVPAATVSHSRGE